MSQLYTEYFLKISAFHTYLLSASDSQASVKLPDFLLEIRINKCLQVTAHKAEPNVRQACTVFCCLLGGQQAELKVTSSPGL